MLVAEDELLVAQSSSDLLGSPAATLKVRSKISRPTSSRVARLFQNTAGIDVHVVGHAPIGIGVGADFDDRRDRRADDRAPARREQHHMRPAGHEFDDLGVVADIGKTEADIAIRNHIQQIKPAPRRDIARFDQT